MKTKIESWTKSLRKEALFFFQFFGGLTYRVNFFDDQCNLPQFSQRLSNFR